MTTPLAALALAAVDNAGAGADGFMSLVDGKGGGEAAQAIRVFVLLTSLSIAPIALLTVTSFTRFVIAFSFLRSGLGLQSTPASLILVALAIFMSGYVMAPTFKKSWNDGVSPYLQQKIGEEEAFDKASQPIREFMARNVRDRDLKTFMDFSDADATTVDAASVPLYALAPAYLISELRRGFEIGFLILVPFLLIDLLVSIVLMSMGMMMVPPSVISLPIKVMFFVLIDGWRLVTESLLRSFV